MRPATVDELAATLRAATRRGAPLTVVGGGTRSRYGRLAEPGPPLSTTGLARVVEHEPAELTATVEAGLAATALADRLRDAGQWWPQADIRPGSTVGGILATASSGRGRLRHGPVRDSVLEVVIVTGDGRVVRGGGRTVKGVAGYDLPRLAVGSHGTLGVIAQVTLKLWPAPPARGWFVRDGALADRIAAAERVRRDAWRPAALLLTPGRLSIELVGAAEDVTAPPGAVPGPPPPEPSGAGIVDAGVPPSALARLVSALEEAGRDYVAEWGVGACRVGISTADDLAAVRATALACGGHAVVVDAPADLRADPWGPEPGGVAIMRRLRRSFDPAGILNPGRFAGEKAA